MYNSNNEAAMCIEKKAFQKGVDCPFKKLQGGSVPIDVCHRVRVRPTCAGILNCAFKLKARNTRNYFPAKQSTTRFNIASRQVYAKSFEKRNFPLCKTLHFINKFFFSMSSKLCTRLNLMSSANRDKKLFDFLDMNNIINRKEESLSFAPIGFDLCQS